MNTLGGSWTTCLGTCSVIVPDETPIQGEVRQLAWVMPRDNLPWYVLNDHSPGSQTMCPGM